MHTFSKRFRMWGSPTKSAPFIIWYPRS